MDTARLAVVGSPAGNDVSPRSTVMGTRGPGAALALLTGAFVASPWIGALYDVNAWSLAALVVVLAVVVAAALGWLRFMRSDLIIGGALAALLVLSALSVLWADSPSRAADESLRVALLLMTYVLATGLLRSGARPSIVVGAFAVTIGLTVLLQYVLVAAAPEGDFLEFRLQSPLGYINGLAGWYCMGLWPLMAAAADRRSSRARSSAAVALATALCSLIVLTQARAVLIALPLGFIVVVGLSPDRLRVLATTGVVAVATAAALPWTLDVFAGHTDVAGAAPDAHVVRIALLAGALSAALAAGAWMVARASRRRTTHEQRRTVAVVLAVVGVLAVAGVVVVKGSPVERARTAVESFRQSGDQAQFGASRFTSGAGNRPALWRVALREFGDEPFAGVGAGSYGLRFFQLRTVNEPVRNPHSLELQLLAELGVLGALALLWLLAGLVIAAVRAMRRRVTLGLAAGAGGVVVTFFAYTSVDWLWSMPGLAGAAILAAAALSGAARPGRGRPLRRVPALVVVLFAAALATTAGRFWLADRAYDRASAEVTSRTTSALVNAQRSTMLDPLRPEPRYVLAAALARLGYVGAAVDELREVSRFEPRNAVPWVLRGDLAVRLGDRAAAEAAYSRAAALDPLGGPGYRSALNQLPPVVP